jgi:putative ABC transport system permease protein
MNRLLYDVRVAGRALVRARFVSALAVIAFALGIGVTTAVFSIFHGVLLEPLPFPEADRIVRVYDTQPACTTCPVSFPKYHAWRERNRVFAAIGGSVSTSRVLTGSAEPARVQGMSTTASLVDVFGVHPAMGRWYSEAEDRPGGPKVVVLTHDLWTRWLGADPAAVGKTIQLNGESHEILGVMPPQFAHGGGEFFIPLQRPLDPTRRNHFLFTYARLKDGVTIERAATEMRELGEVLSREFAQNHGVDVQSHTEAIVGRVRTPLKLLLGAVFLVLLIACANVANLLLAAGMARRQEFAIRLALGARQRDLVRQLTTESVGLAAAGGVIGVLLAGWIVRLFVALAAGRLPRASTIHIDGVVLSFAAAVTIAVGVLCGLWPLLLLKTRQLASVVREGDTRTASAGGRKLGSGLVVAEIALAFALLVGAGLLVKNLVMLRSRDAGIRSDRIVTFDIALSGPRYRAPEQIVAFYRDLHASLTRVDLIESVGMTSHLPMQAFGYNGEMNVEGGNPWGAAEAPLVEYRWMYGDYLKTLGVPLLKGRLLDSRDRQQTRTVLVNQAMAEAFWPGTDPIGRRFGPGTDTAQWFEVVGVIGSIRSLGLEQPAPFEFFRTIEQQPFGAMTVVMRTRSGDPDAVMPTVRQIVSSVDPSLPIARVRRLDQVIADSVAQPRLMSALTALFGTLAGVLAMVGVYGVMAFNVRRQRREFGIRLALGAAQSDVWRLVATRGLVLAGSGIVLGGFGAWLLTGVLTSLLHDVKPTDASIFAGTAAGMLVVALLAAFLPARSAARVDPAIVLRDA